MCRPSATCLWMPVALAVAMTAIAGCGGGTKTVSVASSPPAAQTTATATSTSTATTPAGTGGTGAGTSTTGTGGAPGPATTRTAPAPAFAEKEKPAGANSGSTEGLSAAEAVVQAHGYTAADTSDYRSNQTLRVLVGTGSHSNDGYDKQAFFFVDGRYIGTDSTVPSAQLSVVSQSDTEVTLAYALYRSHDPLCCPGGGQEHVTFQLNDGHLTPLNPIPPVNSSSGLSRQ